MSSLNAPYPHAAPPANANGMPKRAPITVKLMPPTRISSPTAGRKEHSPTAEVAAAMESLYADLGRTIEARRPICASLAFFWLNW